MDESEMQMEADQMEEYGMENEYDMEMGDEGMEDEYGQQEEVGEDESINFDADPAYAHLPPLDKRRKVRREMIRTVNDLRSKFQTGSIFNDVLANKAAEEYAMFLMTNEPQDETFKAMAEAHHAVLNENQYQVLIGNAVLEEENEPMDKYMMDEFMDAHGLLLELQDEQKILTAKEHTHIGIGLAYQGNEVKVVEVITSKPCQVTSLQQNEEGDIEVSGLLLDEKAGLYAARLCSLTNMKKDVALIGPSGFTVDRTNKQFSLTFKGPHEGVMYNEHMLEIYIRKAQPDKIKYGSEADANERIKVDSLTIAVRVPLEYVPDPRTVIEDEADRQRVEKEMADRVKRAEEERLIRVAERLARKEDRQRKKEEQQAAADRGELDDEMSGSQSEDDDKSKSRQESASNMRSSQQKSSQDSEALDDDEDYGEGEDYDNAVGDLPSPPQMKLELIQAICDEIEEYKQLKTTNDNLQRKIILMDDTQREDQKDQLLNEHRYLNTLANVHQVRYNLKETQDRYNRMASELQAKLNEKQAKCQEIETQFKELKRTVAQNAVFSRTGQKLKTKMIKDWEEHEASKDQEVHQYRLQNIALRNRLANQEKIIKKKDQLADGLHLIDFEQLKIENQTLNDKIEERNDELHKLRQKIVTTVVILSHTREKYQYVAKQNLIKKKDVEDLNKKLKQVKNTLGDLKKECDKKEKEYQILKQETGIVSTSQLSNDHKKREKLNSQLLDEIVALKEYHKILKRQIKTARAYQGGPQGMALEEEEEE